jgi:L-seryl-tRNA(Ser) seleniumtransferase
VARLISKLCGAEDAIVVNNNAAAVLLMLGALAKGKDVIISRGELVEIGGGFRIPEVMEQSGCNLKEVGATNRTRLSDYQNAIREDSTGALLKVHTSNYRVIGFTEETPLSELAALGRKHRLPVLYDLGGGSLIPLERYGIQGEPCVSDCVAAGADVLCFSGDKLLGGPQAGIIIGKKEAIGKIKKHPLARAMRIDKLTLAALEATLRLYLEPEKAISDIPVLRMLTENKENLNQKAMRLLAKLENLGSQVGVTSCESQVGGGSVPMHALPSAAVQISPRSISVTTLERNLRALDTPIIGRICKERLLLDLRTVDEHDFDYIASSLLDILEGEG